MSVEFHTGGLPVLALAIHILKAFYFIKVGNSKELTHLYKVDKLLIINQLFSCTDLYIRYL